MALDFLRRSDRAREQYGDRVPPGQRLTQGWPIFTYGGTPHIELQDWKFVVGGAVEEEVAFTWEEFSALPQATVVTDIHCVTGWSKLDNEWRGVPFRELMRHVRPKPEAQHVMAHCYGGYTTHIPLADLMQEDVLLAHTHNGERL